jgi:predicted CopG family antitoxin
MVPMSEWTTIMVTRQTRERLKKLRVAKKETYDEIINRLIDRGGE